MSFGLVGTVLKTSQKFFRAQQELLGKMNGHVEEMYGGHTIVQAFNQQADSIAHFEEINDALTDSAWKSQFFTSIMQPMMQFVGNIGYVIVCILGGYLAVQKTIEISDINRSSSICATLRNRSHSLRPSQYAPADHCRSERVFNFSMKREESPIPVLPLPAR
ncbi:MAG: ABC transporter transmembrane domain-containing protein [Caldilineaceae bacterium]